MGQLTLQMKSAYDLNTGVLIISVYSAQEIGLLGLFAPQNQGFSMTI